MGVSLLVFSKPLKDPEIGFRLFFHVLVLFNLSPPPLLPPLTRDTRGVSLPRPRYLVEVTSRLPDAKHPRVAFTAH